MKKPLTFLIFIAKYLFIGLGVAALLMVFLPQYFSVTQPPTTTIIQPQASYSDMLHIAQSAVVTIQTRSDLFPLSSNECRNNLRSIPSGTNACAFLNNGSGVFINPDGYIVTNAHVIDKAKTIIVELGTGEKLTATVIGQDIDSDIALLAVDHKPSHFLPLPNNDTSRVGDIVFAIGTPYMAFEQTVTQGIVSAKFFSRVSHYIQTDASLRPGNSGGALIDAQGRLVGITSLSSMDDSEEKIYQNFAVLAKDVKHVVDQLQLQGKVDRGWLGLFGDMTINFRQIVEEIELDSEQQQQLFNQIQLLPFGRGIVITAVNGNGPADKAGLQPLDIITKVNGNPINNTGDMMAAIWNLPPKRKVNIEYLRNGKTLSTEVTLGTKP